MSAEETDILQMSNDFYSMFRTFYLKNVEKKKKNEKPGKAGQSKIKSRVSVENTTLQKCTKIEFLGNTSYFSAYAMVRKCVLEFNFADACRKLMISYDDADNENGLPIEPLSSPVLLPKIIGIGIETVFELVQESYATHPSLCIKALEALLKILEGQHPQGLRKDNSIILDSVFNVLLNLSNCEKPEKAGFSKSSSVSNQLRSIATSCLISLAIARGDTKSLLETILTLFSCDKTYISQELRNPEILRSLQLSTEAILVGRPSLPQWLTSGIPNTGIVDSFCVKFPEDPTGFLFNAKALTSDGMYLYLHCTAGLFKVGSGCFGTVKGQIYAKNEDFHNKERVWIGFANGKLYYTVMSLGDTQMKVLSTETLHVENIYDYTVDSKIYYEDGGYTFFTDGEQLGYIMPAVEEGFLVRTMLKEIFDPSQFSNEFNIRLVRKSVEASGPGQWDSLINLRHIETGFDDDISTMTSGKEFTLLRTCSGRLLYCGKGASLGQKVGGHKHSKWLELPLTRAPKFIQCAIGHDGIHAILLAEDGTAYFVGTPRRGEDGDLGTPRRVVKASKPKKVTRMDGHSISYVAVNNGTSAFVTRAGELYMFGKDTAHCDSNGLVSSLRGVVVTHVAMGKAHTVIKTADGQVYTMGMNNKGQCGRSQPLPREDDGADDEDVEWEDGGVGNGAGAGQGPVVEIEGVCPPGTHRWRHDQCMVCTVCRECTGYGSACISALRPGRNPGMECGCGVGDAGCEECGTCRSCAREGLDDGDFLVLNGHRAEANPIYPDVLQLDQAGEAVRAALPDEPADLVEIDEPPEERPPKPGLNSGSSQKTVKAKGTESGSTVYSPPMRLELEDPYITQIACGLYHSVFLSSKDRVFVCGSNSFGQLGIGDVAPRPCPVRIPFSPGIKIIKIAAGSYHTVCLDHEGVVYTAGAHDKNQLGRSQPSVDIYTCWHAAMLPIQNLGTHFGRRVTWIGASSDNTFIRLETSLISPNLLRRSTVTANKSAIMIVPPPMSSLFSSIIINRRDGNCTPFEGEINWPVSTCAITLDPLYNFLWAYEWKTRQMSCFNVVASAIRNTEVESNLLLTKHPFAVPTAKDSKIQRWQAGANLLACIDTVVSARFQELLFNPEEPVTTPNLTKTFSRDDYSSVCRFDSLGGGWGYSQQSAEAVRFCADSDIVLGGLGLFGGRGEYTALLKLFDIGVLGGEVENDGEQLAQSEEIQYETGSRQKYRAMFEEPVVLSAGRWYVAWVHITGPSSDCGSNGQMTVVSDDQITFHFKSSKKSNNGTDVNAGQIPQLLYRSVNSEQCNAMGFSARKLTEPIHILSNDFVSVFNPASVHLLTSLIGWCRDQITQAIQVPPSPENDATFNLLRYVSCSCLRLIECSTIQAYPLKGCGRPGHMENVAMAESIADARLVLQNLITSDIAIENDHIFSGLVSIVQQGCDSFVNCFQVFYPTPYLKWECLKSITHLVLEKNGYVYKRLLSVVLCALCACRGQLLSIFPVLSSHPHEISDETSLTFVTNKEGGKLKPPSNNRLLVSQMTSRFEVDSIFTHQDWNFWQTLKNLMSIMEECENKPMELEKAVVYNSSVLVGKLMEELVSHACGTYGELENVIGQVIVSTPSRFTRTNQSRTWNTGNGSGDAVSFFVDQEGVSVFGACVYSGTGTYEYELDLLQDIEEVAESAEQSQPQPQPAQKWLTLESARGTFDSDDCVGDVAEIRFPRAVHIKAGTKYALRFKNHGGRTCNGDGGVSVLRCADGTTFTFSSCALSFNGTNQIRGQIPYILYFRNPDDSDARQKAKIVAEMEAKKSAIVLLRTIFINAKQRLQNPWKKSIAAMVDQSDSTFVTTLLPSIVAHLPHLAASDPRSSVELLDIIRDILPDVASINNILLQDSKAEKPEKKSDLISGIHYAWVESPHPYKPAALSHYKVTFGDSVQRMTVEFDPRCATAQSEDSLRIFIPFGDDLPQSGTEEIDGISYIPVMDVYSGSSSWPQTAIVLPGSELLFSFETASDYARADKTQYFGFRCLVSGYEYKETSGLIRLELELGYLGGFCTHELIKKSLVLPPVSAEELRISEDTSLSEIRILDVCMRHHALFSKGIGLEYFPTVKEALEGIVPLREKSKEREFIADFIARAPKSGGERLANWLQPDSFVDPAKCEVVAPLEKLRKGKSAVLVCVTRDQHGEPVVASNLQIELKAVPLQARCGGKAAASTGASGKAASSSSDELAMLQTPFQVTVKDKMRYHAISMMKEYENYAFEELRLMSPSSRRTSESMLIRQNNNGTYSAAWTPSCTGLYHISLSVDGYSIPKACTVEVEEAPAGSFTLPRKVEAVEPSLPAVKKRMFKCSDSAGLRVRAHPTLQSEQLGQLPLNGVIGFNTELHNDDGIWVKLEEDSFHQYCQNTNIFQREGWCLQFNQHLGKTLLFPLDPPKSLPGVQGGTVRKSLDATLPNADKGSSKALRLNGTFEYYQVVKCGASGHNIRTRPCLRAPSVGVMTMGAKFRSVDQYSNMEGVWLKLDSDSRRKYSYTKDGEAWALACGTGSDVPFIKKFGSPTNRVDSGFDFSVAAQIPGSLFQSLSPPAAFGSADPRMFFNENLGDLCLPVSEEAEADDNQKQDEDSTQSEAGDEHDIKMTSSPPAQEVPIPEAPVQLRSEAKASLKDSRKGTASEASTDEQPKASARSRSGSTFGALQKWLQMSTESLTSHAPAQSSSSKSASSVLQASESFVKKGFSALSHSSKAPAPSTASSCTQTSPLEAEAVLPVPNSMSFTIGSSGTLPGNFAFSSLNIVQHLGKTPKSERRHKTGSRVRSNRKESSRSPRPITENIQKPLSAVPVKEAIGPGQAQSLRAVFGAILWHAGIIHDAMACASYLKFQPVGSPIKRENADDDPPNYSFDMSDFTRRPKSSSSPKSNPTQRHSVEVTSSPWLQENTNPKRTFEELDFICQMRLSGVARPPGVEESLSGPDNGAGDDGNAAENMPTAVRALRLIWQHVKESCAEALLKDMFRGYGGSVDGTMKPNAVKVRKDKKRYEGVLLAYPRSRGPPEFKVPPLRKKKPKEIQSMGRSFLLEPDDEVPFVEVMTQCEVCHVRFNNKGRNRKACFGLSTLCESCSDNQLKIKKQQSSHGCSSKATSEGDGDFKYISPVGASQSHAIVLNNALFLLQMINTSPEGQLPRTEDENRFSPIVPLENTFSCYEALGFSESQVKNEDDVCGVGIDVSPSQLNFLETDDMSSEDKLALDAILSSPIELGDLEELPSFKPEIPPRRRKTSNGGGQFGEDGSDCSLLSRPSPALQKFLDTSKSAGEKEALSKICGSVISFVTEKHELESLKLFLFQTIRRVTCRSYGMQMLAWLMRNVSQPNALHDLFWWYASSLEPKVDNAEMKSEGLDNGWWQIRQHPLSESPASIFPLLSESFYLLLQTMSDIMPYLPIGSPLLEMAVKCWGVSFSRKDHRFLHKCKIFRNLSQIMSQFDGDIDWSKAWSVSMENAEVVGDESYEFAEPLDDLTPSAEIKVSSRILLCPSLIDDSTETFWESGEEDRNRTKSITIINEAGAVIKVVGLYVDNVKDSQHRVSAVSIKVSTRPDEFFKCGSQEMDSKSVGWTWFPIEWIAGIRVVRIDCKGADNTLRVRQVKILGMLAELAEPRQIVPGGSAFIARRKCENETLRIFRLLSSEVFGKLLSQIKLGEDDEGNDLQEHVVGILFSRNKLTHLQKQVCCHVVSAIHREAMKIKMEFDSLLIGSVLEVSDDNVRLVSGDKPKIADRYCFEMLSLVLALAGSKVGRSYLSQQSNLIYDLVLLLHIGTPRIQRQVILVLRKVLPEIKPEDFGKIVCYYEKKGEEMVPRLEILDFFLGIIAKALHVKARSTNSSGRCRVAKQISINDAFNFDELPYQYWFLHGEVEGNLANTVVKLIKDLTEGVFSKEWEIVAKEAVAEGVRYLPSIKVGRRDMESCLSSPKFWLSIAALCVLHRDHSDQLSYPSYENGSTGRPFCVNHDDGETIAVMQCTTCGDLCNDCDRILHLPKAKWSHARRVCKEEEESIDVNLHEGCGRIKLFWLMALADCSTLKTLVEFRNGMPKISIKAGTPVQTVGRCRFCNKTGNTGPLALGNICGDAECQEFGRTACEKTLACGHLCGGVKAESRCLPCLHRCPNTDGINQLRQDGEDLCIICFTEVLTYAPAIEMDCGHVFHYHCCRGLLERKWVGPRITFTFCRCPICKAEINNELLHDVLGPIRELYVEVQRKSLMRLEYEGLTQSEAITLPGGRFFRNPGGYAMDRYAYYMCYKCKKPYFGGDARCHVEIQLEFDPQELVCGGCSDVTQAQLCPKHGTDYLEYKCRYCCSVAVFFCFGTTHFCNGCHDDFQRITTIPKPQLPHCPAGPRAKQLELEDCPLHVTHPPTGEEFALGCGVCRNAHTF